MGFVFLFALPAIHCSHCKIKHLMALLDVTQQNLPLFIRGAAKPLLWLQWFSFSMGRRNMDKNPDNMNLQVLRPSPPTNTHPPTHTHTHWETQTTTTQSKAGDKKILWERGTALSVEMWTRAHPDDS